MHNNEECGMFITLYDFCDINYIYLARTYAFNILFLFYHTQLLEDQLNWSNHYLRKQM